MLSVIIFMYSKVLPHKRPYILRGGKRMLREIRSWQEGKTIFSHVKYVGRDFYGPMLDLIIIHEEDLMPVVEVIASSYKFEDVAIADGINVTVEKAAKEIFDKYGNHKIKTKFGDVLITSSNTTEAFDDFRKSLLLF